MKIRRMRITTQDKMLLCFLTSFIVSRIVNLPTLIANMLPAAFGLACFAYVIMHKKQKYLQTALLMLIVMSLFMLFSMLYNNNCDVLDLIWIWAFGGVSIMLFTYRFNSKLVLFQYYTFALYLLVKILRGVPARDVLSIGSQNNISVYLLMYLALYYFFREIENGKERYSIIPVAVAALISFWTTNRSATLCFFLFGGLLLFYNIFISGKGLKTILLTTGVFAISIFFIYKYYDTISTLFLGSFIDKMNTYGYTSLRTEIWKEYIDSTTSSFTNIVFGPNTRDRSYYWLSIYDGNVHNAFFILHAHYGLMAFLGFSLLSIRGTIRFLQNGRYVSVIVILILSIRSFFDWTSFPGIYDVFYILIMLVAVTKNWYFITEEERDVYYQNTI